MGNSKLDQYSRVYKEGTVIFEEGEVGDTVLLINSGKVEILKGFGADQRKIVTLGDGELVGEMAMGEGEHERTATVKTITKVEGWRFPGPAFESLIEKKKEFRQKLVRSLVDRLIDTTNRLAQQESSEIMDMNRSLVKSAFAHLAFFEPSEIEDDNAVKSDIVSPSDEYLAYRYGVDLEAIEQFRELNEGNELGNYDDKTRIELSDLAQDIVDDLSESVSTKFPPSDYEDHELVEATQEAKTLLDKLEDHTETYDNDKLQRLMEKRKDYVEILDERRAEGRDDYIVNLLEDLITGIKQEINIRYD